VLLKGPVDPVTATDLAAEAHIKNRIGAARPGDRLLAEESAGVIDLQGRTWLIDPLDGTVNFSHGIPQVAVSIALYQDGQPRVAVVVDAIREDLFVATAGGGSKLNGAAISVSTRELGEAVVATGFPYDRRQRGKTYAAIAGSVLEKVRGIRRLGAAALDLAWVAAGRLDGYWEFGLAPWDVAAGMLLVREAGGVVGGLDGGPVGVEEPLYIAGNPAVQSGLREVLAAAIPAGWLR
jgi:myo-inositol-1(or 4)-monophosphatase